MDILKLMRSHQDEKQQQQQYNITLPPRTEILLPRARLPRDAEAPTW